MNIGLNLLYLIPGKVGGTENFARNIVKEISTLDKKNNYFIYLNNENKDLFSNLPSNFKIIHCKFNATNRFIRTIWEQIILPLQCLTNRIDTLHSLGYTAPLITHCKKITTIYDLNYYYFPEDFSRLYGLVMSILMPLVAKSSDIILVHSKKSKEEISSVFNIKKNKIYVAYGGVSDVFRLKYSSGQISKTLKKYKVNKPFILSAATSHPHKNLDGLVLAYKYLVNKYKIKHNLVLLGFSGRGQNKLNELLSDPEFKKRVILTGWVDPFLDMPKFYKSASLFVFPSLYEGFGLPLVESMACGVPLIASNASCIPEVVGNGGVITDATDYKKLAISMYKVITNKKLSKSLVKKGIAKSMEYNWQDLASYCIRLYEK